MGGLSVLFKRRLDSALKYYTKAAELKNVEAHFDLASMYYFGRGVEKNEKKKNYHVEEAAIGGHFVARHLLGDSEITKNGDIGRAVKLYIIAASLGYDVSLDALGKLYREGQVTKEDYAAVLRAHQAAVDATKSPQREAAESVKLNRLDV